ncbi:MAG: transcriptional regulator [Phormidium sp. GEM2.Bin31]|nr:MAG: transcriptional regulator [Phormidium sp. GEM2.Bin31]
MVKSTEIFTPDWVSPPGDTILDLLEERDWTPVQLAECLGYSSEYINQLIRGKAPITENIAICLENVLGSTAKFWLQREIQYRSQLEKINQEGCLK